MECRSSRACRVGSFLCSLECRVGTHLGLQDAAEEIGRNVAKGEGSDRFARFGQIAIGLSIERGAGVARCSYPLRKLFGWHRICGEVHIGKAVTAKLCGKSTVLSGMIGL